MIVFTHNPSFIPLIQDKANYNKTIVFNVSSLYHGYIDLTCLVTSIAPINHSSMPTNVFVDSLDFDMQYANAIMNNNTLFEAFMNIVMNAYEGYTVIVLVYREPYRDAILESLIKLIQQRYGYNSWIVSDIDDISCLKESAFNPMGLMTLDQDIRRYETLYQYGGVSSRIIGSESIEY